MQSCAIALEPRNLHIGQETCGLRLNLSCTQVLFDGGLWFVGVVAALERDSYGDATAAVLLFEGL